MVILPLITTELHKLQEFQIIFIEILQISKKADYQNFALIKIGYLIKFKYINNFQKIKSLGNDQEIDSLVMIVKRKHILKISPKIKRMLCKITYNRQQNDTNHQGRT